MFNNTYKIEVQKHLFLWFPQLSWMWVCSPGTRHTEEILYTSVNENQLKYQKTLPALGSAALEIWCNLRIISSVNVLVLVEQDIQG